jgi:predicted Mrr-cat superfamily restriction endonuclease
MAEKKTEAKVSPEVVEKETGKALSEQKKVRVRIPADKLNKHDVVVPVCVNGYTYQIKRGEWVEVPQTVADILEQAGYLG